MPIKKEKTINQISFREYLKVQVVKSLRDNDTENIKNFMTDKARTDQQYYYKGYSSSISNTHRWRTAGNCLGFMLPYVKPNDHILDVGCGVGTITCDLAKYVPEGKIIGIEPTKEVLEDAISLGKEQQTENVTFGLGSAYSLPYEDNSFDIVFCHQVLIHLQDQIVPLKEMLRVTKPNGYVCCKEGDIGSMFVYPTKYSEAIEHFFMKEYLDLQLGRKLKAKALSAGYRLEDIAFTFDNYGPSTDKEKTTWADMYIKRALTGKESITSEPKRDEEIKKNFVSYMKDWSLDKSSTMVINSGELVYKKTDAK